MDPFRDRAEAGKHLAEKLAAFSRASGTLILALVRGGVAVGRALADRLRIPLFPYVVRKIGMPGNREYGVGAIAEGGSVFWDRDALAMTGLSEADLQPVVEEERAELLRRTKAYAVRSRPELAGKTIILTDDGAATGGTLFAAIADLRSANAGKIVVALPVAPPDTALRLRERADDAVILQTPRLFQAVGQWYLSFPQLTDEEVIAFLREKTPANPWMTS